MHRARTWKLRNLRRYRFLSHRASARQRGIAFYLTFDEWWSIWERSGRWSKRGCRKGQYVMARIGDKGPYAVGNVKIVRQETNHLEGPLPPKLLGAANHAAKMTPAKVIRLRKMHESGKYRTQELAFRFGISAGTVWKIAKRWTWQNV